jgi:protein required for attachment to host cells
VGRIVTPEVLENVVQTINTQIGRIVTPDILESITQTINTKIGKVVTPAIAKELTQEVNVKTGKVDLKPIPTELTQKVDVEQGDVNLPAIPAEVTQTVDVETGRMNLLNIPEVIEQTVNTHQGELMTADIATEITQKINTVLGNIVKPEILDEVTQTINTKVGEVITPEIAKEVTQVVNVETGTVDLEPIPTETTTKVDFQADTRNINAAISDVKKEMDTISVGTIKFNLDQTKLVDLTTLKTLIDEQVKNGLEIDPEATQGLFSKIQLGIDIEDTTWQDLIDKINEKLKELDIEPISINFKTGDTAKTGKETENAWKNAASAVQSVGSALQQIEDPSAKIVGIIGQAIANIALGFAQATAASSGGGIFAWIAAITGGLATMISTISAIHSATGYADGGIVKGNTYSGDQIPALVDGSQMVGLNAGEVVLNRSQQGVLAASLQAVGQSGEGGGGGRPYVSGELIWLGLNNYLNRSGRGEIVTSKRR